MSNTVKILIGLACVGLALALAPVLLNLERYTTPQDHPEARDATYLDLPSGRTHYVASGTGPTVLLVAGLTGNHTVWDRSQPGLEGHYRTIAMDTYGRGFSERRPAYAYGRELYRRQLVEFLAARQITRTAIIGTSMGGAIAIDFAVHYPEMVSALVLVDTAGLPFETPAVSQLVKVPWLGEYLVSLVMPLILHQGFERGFHDPARADDHFRARYSLSAEIKGFKRAVLESARHMPLHTLEPEIKALAALDIPILLVWGKEDRIVPISVHTRLRQLLPDAQSIVIHDSGHMPHAERPELFVPNTLAFLRQVVP